MTNLLLPSRRNFLRSLLAAPAIIKLAPLMAIRPQPRNLLIPGRIVYIRTSLPAAQWRALNAYTPTCLDAETNTP